MLTHVKECVDTLSYDDMVSSLFSEEKGYYVVDQFLQQQHIVSQMEKEAVYMQQEGLLTLETLGTGEYSRLLTGGDSYKDSPRCIEFVVSFTRHLPPLFNKAIAAVANNGSCALINLDNTACMGKLLTFDRNAKMASLQLLIGNDATAAADLENNPPDSARPFTCVTENSEIEDARKITAVYFMTDEQWDLTGSDAGITFQSAVCKEEYVAPKCDRLVVFQSDASKHQKEGWKGKVGTEYASCLMVHLCAEWGK